MLTAKELDLPCYEYTIVNHNITPEISPVMQETNDCQKNVPAFLDLAYIIRETDCLCLVKLWKLNFTHKVHSTHTHYSEWGIF